MPAYLAKLFNCTYASNESYGFTNRPLQWFLYNSNCMLLWIGVECAQLKALPYFYIQRAAYPMLLMIDNYDSFTYNLVQYFQRLNQDVLVKRNDDITISEIKTLNPEHIVLSPGPRAPNEAGISLSVVEQLKGIYPILGICLGHQTIAQALGAQVIRAKQVMHGKTSPIFHQQQGVFKGLANPLTVCRYHSLVVDKATLPNALSVTAWTEDERGDVDEIMGLLHNELALEGVQFHPEAILTEQGLELLANFLTRF